MFYLAPSISDLSDKFIVLNGASRIDFQFHGVCGESDRQELLFSRHLGSIHLLYFTLVDRASGFQALQLDFLITGTGTRPRDTCACDDAFPSGLIKS